MNVTIIFMNTWTTIPSDETIQKTMDALTHNGISPILVSNKDEAEKKTISLIPKGASVMNGSSTTLKQIGFIDYLKEGNHGWNNLHKDVIEANGPEDYAKRSKQATIADYFLGSVHAVTEDGTVVVASNSGSQLPAYAYNASHVLWVVSANKIVKNLDEALKRIYEHILPLESERANKAYNMTSGSFVSKMLVINRETNPKRIQMILVKEVLGF